MACSPPISYQSMLDVASLTLNNAGPLIPSYLALKPVLAPYSAVIAVEPTVASRVAAVAPTSSISLQACQRPRTRPINKAESLSYIRSKR